MRLERRAVIVCCCCCVWPAACGGAAKLAATQGPSFTQTVSLTANGAPLDLSAQASLSLLNPPSYAQIIGQDGVIQPAHTVQIVLGAYPLTTGATQTCGMSGAGIGYSANGKAFASGNCTITVTTYSGPHQPFEGTFSGTVNEAGGTGSSVVITNGHFKVVAQ